MRFQLLSIWLLAIAIVSQAAAAPTGALPELIATRQTKFAIPFRIEPSDDPAWQPIEAQLYVSTDRGAKWQLYTKATTAQKQFNFVAGGDGEFWFAIRTADRWGKARPSNIGGPGLRVLVDTKPPVLKFTAQPGKDGQVVVRWEIDEPHVKPKGLSIVYRPSDTEPWEAVRQNQSEPDSLKGEASFWPRPGSTEIPIRAEVYDMAGNPAVANVRVKLDQPSGPRPSEAAAIPSGTAPFTPSEDQDAAQRRSDESASDVGPALTPAPDPKNAVAAPVNPAIGQQYPTTDAPTDAGPTLPAPPLGERPRMVNSRTFELEYDVDSVGPSGIGRVELWGTRDGGQTWRSFAVDADKRSPLQVGVKEEGIYGFRVVVSNGSGFGGKPPASGDQPDLSIGVDLTKPTARIVSAKQGATSETGQLIISWQADDSMLAARPVSLSFSEKRGGPWLPIAAGLENTGRYAWSIDNRTPSQTYLRLEARDEAGNLAAYETTEPVVIDQSHPTVRIRSVRPVSQPDRETMRRR